jgi:hypothetical protein
VKTCPGVGDEGRVRPQNQHVANLGWNAFRHDVPGIMLPSTDVRRRLRQLAARKIDVTHATREDFPTGTATQLGSGQSGGFGPFRLGLDCGVNLAEVLGFPHHFQGMGI